jgi:uncharacterized protein
MPRILAFSDLHAARNRAEAIIAAAENADLVIGAGDFCNFRQGLAPVMDWFAPIAAKLVVVPGNAESADELRAATLATVLHGQATTMAGLRIFGLGYAVPVTPFGDWSCDLTEADAAAMLGAMLPGIDILISHSPPKGVADRNSGGLSLGAASVRAAIERAQPRYCLSGHIHESWGQTGAIGSTTVINLGPVARWIES